MDLEFEAIAVAQHGPVAVLGAGMADGGVGEQRHGNRRTVGNTVC
jgi:hypothetical protein